MRNTVKELKLLSLFSGIGAFEKALSNIGVDYDLVGFSEIDKYAIKSYCAIHNVSEDLNLGDITKIDIKKLPKNIDMITHGSPCQDYSIAGKQEGGDKGSGTRSSLMWYSVEIIRHCKPKYVIWENVKNVLSKKHKHNFDKYIKDLENIGYTSYYEVLNAKDFGIPQNRERVYCISIYKGIADNFKFPQGKKLTVRLKDILEDSVDEKYYLSEEIQNRFKLTKEIKENNNVIGTTMSESSNIGQRYAVYNIEGIMGSLLATDYKQPKQILEIDAPKIIQLGNVVKTGKWKNPQRRRIYSTEGISPCLNTVGGGGLEPKIMVEKIKQMVKVRKYPVDIEKLKKVLQEHKKGTKLTVQSIARRIGVNKTTAEHWFRSDSSFSIPSEDIWYDLKNLLKIKTDEFDKSIMEFEYRENEYDMSNRVYNIEGISPTLTATGESGAKKIKIPITLENDSYVSRKYIDFVDKNGYIPELFNPYNCKEVTEVAQTTQCGSMTSSATVLKLEGNYKIRKLTPLECWRLMGFKDEDFYNAQNIPTSNSQLYKQAGNSIVVNVLEEIFKQLFKNCIRGNVTPKKKLVLKRKYKK